MTGSFDAYIAVDWSARGNPSPRRPSPDAIWISETDPTGTGVVYVRTRSAAMHLLRSRLVAHVEAGRRVLAGFDFAFGFPQGFAAAITEGNTPEKPGKHRSAGQWSRPADSKQADGKQERLSRSGQQDGASTVSQAWARVWSSFASLVEDDRRNRNNRFEVASLLNRRCLAQAGPFWGHPPGRSYDRLEPTSPAGGYPVRASGGTPLDRYRITERAESAAGVQPVWKLYGPASVGGQTLTGIAHLEALRRDCVLSPYLALFPFETGFRVPSDARVVLSEIWPNLFPFDTDDSIRDRAQVRAVTAGLQRLDRAGRLHCLFAPPSGMTSAECHACEQEEGWILGAGQLTRAPHVSLTHEQ